ncbi:hypothetical protein [Ramlibacter sp. Leaf400]|uniref:hypothetical protein n=1 Tax=Ramlibacter sp. Leaf400 TaxID=1736365 RepID=UPI0009E82C5F|nr:hypothetical protein [Ramlibacter sp. Leaf400]
MNRWILLPAALLLAAAVAQAQVVIRSAPAGVKPARLTVTAPPQITLNGQPDRLSPGARIRGTNNLMLLSGSVVGQVLPVVYRRDAAGLVHEVWVLTDEEYSRVAPAEDGSPDGHKRFAELLDLIFGARK